MNRLGSVLWAGVVSWVLGGCVASEVTYTSATKYPAKPKGCAVEVFPSTTPSQGWDDLATVEARCHTLTQGRTACIEELKARACELGGDSVYALKDGKDTEYSIVIGTIARRKEAAPQPVALIAVLPPASTSAPHPSVGCDPPCSPGYQCGGTQCLAVCNPPCGEGQLCTQQRVCAPGLPAPAAPSPTAPPL